MDYHTYKNSITEPAPKVFQPETATQYTEEKNFVLVRSNDRDLNLYPNPAQFQITLQREFRNIKSIRVVQGTIANTSDTRLYPYLLLDIPELNFINVQGLGTDVTAMISLLPNMNNAFLNFDSTPLSRITTEFKAVKDRINRLNVTLRSPDGTVLDWANETTQPIDPTMQVSFLLEITTIAPKRFTTTLNYSVPTV